ncbi:MAG: DUF2924 domain-containing protein [Armatimonadota bacterium]
MNRSTLRQIADLPNLTTLELQELWMTLNGKEPPSCSRDYLIRRLAYRIQEITFGGLSTQTKQLMGKVLESYGYDENGCRINKSKKAGRRTNGMPIIGTRLLREWKGTTYEVVIVNGGCEYKGVKFNSLTAVATSITGTHWNGRSFFRLQKLFRKKATKKVSAVQSDDN